MDNKIITLAKGIELSDDKNYAIKLMKLNYLWKQGYTGKDIKIGIVDTGIDYNHEVFENRIICGKNLFNNGTNREDYFDDNFHGTSVASLVAGKQINKNLSGVAFDAQLVIAKGLNASGNGTLHTIAEGINYCVEQGVDVINCSVGCPVNSTELENALRNAVKHNISVVCAMGNEGHGDNGEIRELSYPAGYDDSICVGSIDNNYQMSDFSNSNEYVDLVAPGSNIICAYPNNQYAKVNGTSFSAPLITGALALLKQKFRVEFKREPSESELFAQLIKHTRLLQNVDLQCQGNGFFDASINPIKKL